MPWKTPIGDWPSLVRRGRLVRADAAVVHYPNGSGRPWLGTEMEIRDKVRAYQQTVAFLQKNYGVLSGLGYRTAMAVLLTGNLIKTRLRSDPLRIAGVQDAPFKRKLAWHCCLRFSREGKKRHGLTCNRETDALASARGFRDEQNGKRCVAMVMHRATQFDGPLFAKLARDRQLEVKVYYTAPGTRAVTAIDPEIGISPEWGEMATAGYAYETRAGGIIGLMRYLCKIVAGKPDLIIISGYRPFFHVLVALYACLRRVPVGLPRTRPFSTRRRQGHRSKDCSSTSAFGFSSESIPRRIRSARLPASTWFTMACVKSRSFPSLTPSTTPGFGPGATSTEHARPEIRRELGIPEDAFVVLGI